MHRLLIIFLVSSLSVAQPVPWVFDCLEWMKAVGQKAALRSARKRIRRASIDYQAMHTLPLLFNKVEDADFRRRTESYPVRQLVDKTIRVVIPKGPSSDRIAGGEFVEGVLVDVSSDGKTLYVFHEGTREHVKVPRYSTKEEMQIEMTDGEVVEKTIIRETENEIYFPYPEDVDPIDFKRNYRGARLAAGLTRQEEALIEAQKNQVMSFLANFGYGPEVVHGRAKIGFQLLKEGESPLTQQRWVEVETKAGPVRIQSYELMGFATR